MAFTVVKTPTVFGNMRVVMMDITADAATQTIDTGLGKIVSVSYTPVSMGTSNIHMGINSNATGAVSMGAFSVTGCANGDRFFVNVFGN